MRHVGWWKEFSDGSVKEKGAELTSKVNSMLKERYGHKDEPHFEGKKKWPGGSGGSDERKVYEKMRHMVGGHYSKSIVDSMLEGVDESRAVWYKGKARANRPAWEEANKKHTEEGSSREKAARKRMREGGA
jgi:hypothetical protein